MENAGKHEVLPTGKKYLTMLLICTISFGALFLNDILNSLLSYVSSCRVSGLRAVSSVELIFCPPSDGGLKK